MRKILETIKQKWAEYLLETFVIVLSILGAFALDNWNNDRKDKLKEIEILQGFHDQFKNDLVEIDSSLTFYREGKESIDIILNHLENDQPYNDSLKFHFFRTTRYWMTSDLDNHQFETLKSIGVDLISNKALRQRIIKMYEDEDDWIEESENAYLQFLFNASENTFNTRFKDFGMETIRIEPLSEK